MQIKNICFALLFCLATSCSARPEAEITFKVIDDDGKPLNGIPVQMGTFIRHVPGDGFGKDIYNGPKGRTDTNGMVVLTYPSLTGRFGYGAGAGVMKGYYYDRGGEYVFSTNNGSRWQPWNPTVEIVFKPVLNPVPVYLNSIETHLKKTNQKFGFDLIIGDWVFPDGTGQESDVFFEVIGFATAYNNNDSTLIVSFPKTFDGIQEFQALPPGRGSAFRSPRFAPMNGYLQEIRLRKVRRSEQMSPEFIDDTAKDHNYFFRIRSVVDEQGNLKSALYGKLEGGFEFWGATNNSYLNSKSYYINHEPNSRNMEFDLKRNLFKPLKPARNKSR